MKIKFVRVPSWDWPGARYPRLGAWRHNLGITLRWRDRLLCIRVGKHAKRMHGGRDGG